LKEPNFSRLPELSLIKTVVPLPYCLLQNNKLWDCWIFSISIPRKTLQMVITIDKQFHKQHVDTYY